MFGRLHSPESLVLMSEAKKGENHPMSGRTHSAESKAKISLAQTGKHIPRGLKLK